MNKVFNVGLIGCGHISETYFRGHEYFNNFKIIKCADLNKEASNKCAQDYNIISCTVDELLNDPEIEIILNFKRSFSLNNFEILCLKILIL